MVKQKEDVVGAYFNSGFLTCISFHQSQPEKKANFKRVGERTLNLQCLNRSKLQSSDVSDHLCCL